MPAASGTMDEVGGGNERGEQMQLGTVGVWLHHTRTASGLAATIEAAGFGALWLGGTPSGETGHLEATLAETDRIVVATGIVNIWKDDPAWAAETFHRLDTRFPGRFLLGVGAGHRETAERYGHPYEALVTYLDALDDRSVPAGCRALAALGPRVLHLAARRTAGAHPYNVTPSHTVFARSTLGPKALLAPEQKVVLDMGERGRELARTFVGPYLAMRNYLANMRRMGFDDADVVDGGSDRLLDGLFAFGLDAAALRVRAHLDAGADHVAVQLITAPDLVPAPPAYVEMANALGLS